MHEIIDLDSDPDEGPSAGPTDGLKGRRGFARAEVSGGVLETLDGGRSSAWTWERVAVGVLAGVALFLWGRSSSQSSEIGRLQHVSTAVAVSGPGSMAVDSTGDSMGGEVQVDVTQDWSTGAGMDVRWVRINGVACLQSRAGVRGNITTQCRSVPPTAPPRMDSWMGSVTGNTR